MSVTIAEARAILETSSEFVLGEKTLSDAQVERAIELAAEEAAEWAEETDLPDPETMHIDLFLDDLEDSGITWVNMMRLVFLIVRRINARRDEILAALDEAGYDAAAVSGSRVIVSVTTCDEDEDEDFDHSAIPAEIAAVLPEWASASWTGNSQTDGDGETTSDLAITWGDED